MTFPPFPSQDLAKLVLGYLAEEQLMTVYDEFLRASPYLDALRNEYDRIFMTSLKNILAEYRAVKIYVDTCKPYMLRKKIFQCTNLLDVVKFLISNVDINKIQLQEASSKVSIEKQKDSPNACEVCNASKLANCICKSRQSDDQRPESISASHLEASALQNSVEATPLADLPGNHISTRKKQVKVLEKDTVHLNSSLNSGQNSDQCQASVKQSFSSIISPEEYLANCQSPVKTESSTSSLNLTAKAVDPSITVQNFEEFDNVLKSVGDKNKALSEKCQSNYRISNATTFNDFASGVTSCGSQNATYNVPDSSTSESLNLNFRASLNKEHYNYNNKGSPSCQLMLQLSHINDNIKIQTCRRELPKSIKLTKIQPKPMDTKVKIISDVKVGTKYSDAGSDRLKINSVPNATSTPLMQMQTIMINGTPAYKHTLASRFTKDEIMAMPTLIVVPASGPSEIPTSVHCEPIMTQNCDILKTTTSPAVLGPLVIDVQSNVGKPTVTALPDLSEPKSLGPGLVKTVDLKNASAPKDNVNSLESNTPQVLPPTRKSSSTPRRTSHVRVLDFATPRRILHETSNEQISSQTSDPPLEVILSDSPNVVSTLETTSEVVTKSEVITALNVEGNNNNVKSTKENNSSNKVKQVRKYDWDADLRALLVNEQIETETSQQKSQKRKPKTSKPKKSTPKSDNSNKTADNDKPESKKKTRTRKKSPKVKKTNIKNIEESDDSLPTSDIKCEIPMKPIVNIICSNYHDKPESHNSKNEPETNQNKSPDKDDGLVDTPEAERLSLQNVIGAKLNLSDLLETPYKQALYDIQMETPRFLGPDLPDDPVSDIKIMNIPTPRFLNTPKAVQATPSSYASRPTDYSSGGSYYKPDDQDYMPLPDLMPCPVSSSKEDIRSERSTEKDSESRKSRPVRQCTKNVSYYRNVGVGNKTRDVEEFADVASSCSEVLSVNSSFETKIIDDTISKTPRLKTQSLNKSENKKKSSTFRKRKDRKSPKVSTDKDKTKSFMKIKPRYTPKKETSSTKNKKSLGQSPRLKCSPNFQHKKGTISRDKLTNPSPLVVALPTKSRRKSSTPRKINCTKNFNSESSGHDSPENITSIKSNVSRQKCNSTTQDSDNEQLALRWSDDGSQDGKIREVQINTPVTEIENIDKIQEFIEASQKTAPSVDNSKKRVDVETDLPLQEHLVKQGFDLVSAESVERDLRGDTPSHTESTVSGKIPITVEIVETNKDDTTLEKTDEVASSVKNESQTAQEEMDEDEIEFSVHECNEERVNYITFEHDDTKEISQQPPVKLKDNYTMEVCIDDVTMRLIATPIRFVIDHDPIAVDEIDYSCKEIEQAVESISNMDRLYTPLKEAMQAQCYEIFDSTLTSLDTPIKSKCSAIGACATTVTDLVLGGGKESKDKAETKKRKRHSVSDEPANSKRTKPDADLLLKTANIQNIDIETVLTKLHGH